MGLRSRTAGVISSVISFASLVKATAAATLFVAETADDTNSDECEWYGNPAVLARPPAGADAVFVDLDGDRVIIGVRETRWTVQMDEGDAVLRALGAGTRSFVRLKANGDVEVNGARVFLGDASASNFVAMANLVTAQLNVLKTAITTAQVAVVSGDGGAAFAASLVGSLSTWPLSVASSRVRSL